MNSDIKRFLDTFHYTAGPSARYPYLSIYTLSGRAFTKKNHIMLKFCYDDSIFIFLILNLIVVGMNHELDISHSYIDKIAAQIHLHLYSFFGILFEFM